MADKPLYRTVTIRSSRADLEQADGEVVYSDTPIRVGNRGAGADVTEDEFGRLLAANPTWAVVVEKAPTRGRKAAGDSEDGA